MTVEIHKGMTKLMEDRYQDYDLTNWRLYGTWMVLQKLPKFAIDYKVTEKLSTTSVVNSNRSNTSGTITDDTDINSGLFFGQTVCKLFLVLAVKFEKWRIVCKIQFKK